jgi:hypothetical protein
MGYNFVNFASVGCAREGRQHMSMSREERLEQIERYAQGAARLRDAVAQAPQDALRFKPSEKAWSIHEIAVHCADAELTAAARIRYVVAEKDPLIVGYDQDEWARVCDYVNHPLDIALATVDAVRAHTAVMLRGLPQDAWLKVGRHSERGAYSAEDWLKIYVAHLEKHVQQIARNVSAWRAKTDRKD